MPYHCLAPGAHAGPDVTPCSYCRDNIVLDEEECKDVQRQIRKLLRQVLDQISRVLVVDGRGRKNYRGNTKDGETAFGRH
jgi:hypothetical protein